MTYVSQEIRHRKDRIHKTKVFSCITANLYKGPTKSLKLLVVKAKETKSHKHTHLIRTFIYLTYRVVRGWL